MTKDIKSAIRAAKLFSCVNRTNLFLLWSVTLFKTMIPKCMRNKFGTLINDLKTLNQFHYFGRKMAKGAFEISIVPCALY